MSTNLYYVFLLVHNPVSPQDVLSNLICVFTGSIAAATWRKSPDILISLRSSTCDHIWVFQRYEILSMCYSSQMSKLCKLSSFVMRIPIKQKEIIFRIKSSKIGYFVCAASLYHQSYCHGAGVRCPTFSSGIRNHCMDPSPVLCKATYTVSTISPDTFFLLAYPVNCFGVRN